MGGKQTLLGSASILLCTVQYFTYFRGIFAGRVRPHLLTWLIWALVAGITFSAQIVKGGGAGAWATGYTGLLCAAVFAVSFTKGDRNAVPLDWVCVFCALAAIVLWIVTDNPLNAVICVTVANGLGFLPTLRKSIDRPHEEALVSYMVSNAKWTCSILALQALNWTTLLYPVSALVLATGFVAIVFVRRWQTEQSF